MLKQSHFTPQRMISMLGLRQNSVGPYALIPGPKERSELLLKLLEAPEKNFTFLDYEMHTGSLDGKRVTVGNGDLGAGQRDKPGRWRSAAAARFRNGSRLVIS